MSTTAPAFQTAGAKSPKTHPTDYISKDGKWRYLARVPCLRQYVPTGVYFARVKVKGKSICLSLETDSFAIAKLKLPDKLKQLRKPKPVLGTFAQAREYYQQKLIEDHNLGEGTRNYRRNCLKALKKTWPSLDQLPIGKITAQSCQEWAGRFLGADYDDQYFNNTLGTLRAILKLAGLGRDENPAYQVSRTGVKRKQLTLPKSWEFEQIVEVIEAAGAPQSQHCADLVRFLAYSGCRITEAKGVHWEDVDFGNNEIKVRNGKRRRKSSEDEFRFIPIIPPMLELLRRLEGERTMAGDALRRLEPQLADRVCLVSECEKSLTNACKKVGCARITHHDLRHLFATRCIEAGVDIPTVSRWLGHVDGGALAMKVYGHLRREHSTAMARKVTFGHVAPDANIIQLPLTLEQGRAE